MTTTPNNIASEEWEKEFDENFTYASFTWNGDNKTGVDFAKKTKRRVKAFIHKTRQKAIAGERKRILEDLDLEEQMPENFLGWTPEGDNNNLERFCTGYNACKEYVEWVFAGRPEPVTPSPDTSERSERWKCKSYYENGIVYDCTCGKCF